MWTVNEIQKAFRATEGLDAERAEWESYQGAKGLYGNAVYALGAPGGISVIGYTNGSGWLRTTDGKTVTFPIRTTPFYFQTEADFIEAINGREWNPAIPVAPPFVPIVSDGRIRIMPNPHADSGIVGVEKDGDILFRPSKNGVKWKDENIWWRSRLTRDGLPISVGWPKFHNLEERPEFLVRINRLLASGKTVPAYEKLDGTLLIRSELDGIVKLRTRGSHSIGGMEDSDADHEDFGQVNLQEIREEAQRMGLLELGLAPESVCLLFEYVSPSNRIVIGYDRPGIILIGAVDYLSETLITPEDALAMTGKDWPVAKKREISGKNVKEAVAAAFSGAEGAVIWYAGWIYKFKNEDYLWRFKAKFMLNKKFVITMALKEQVYDPLALLDRLTLPEECLTDVSEWLQQFRSEAVAFLSEVEPMREFARNTNLSGAELKDAAMEKFEHSHHICFAEKNGKALRVIAFALAKRLDIKAANDTNVIPNLEGYLGTLDERAGA